LALIGLLGGSWGEKFPAISALTTHLPGVLRGLAGRLSEFNPNIIGGALLWVVPLQFALAAWTILDRQNPPDQSKIKNQKSKIPGLGLTALALLGAATLVLTQSRSALSGAVVGLAVLLWLGGRRTRWLLAAGLVAGVIGVLALGPQAVADRLLAVAQAGSGPTDSRGTLAGRLDIWARAVYGIQAFPLTGMGMDTFGTLLPVLYPLFPPATAAPTAYAEITHAHNQLLQVGLDLGLPGLVAFGAIWLLAGALLIQTWRAAPDPGRRAVTAGLTAGLVAYAVFGLTDTVIFVAKPDVLFWALLGLLIAGWRLAAQNPNAEPPIAHPAIAEGVV
jgi:O-antigen ligase